VLVVRLAPALKVAIWTVVWI